MDPDLGSTSIGSGSRKHIHWIQIQEAQPLDPDLGSTSIGSGSRKHIHLIWIYEAHPSNPDLKHRKGLKKRFKNNQRHNNINIRSGGNLEIMGLLLGRVDCIIILLLDLVEILR